jgi:hypothetical protein
MRDAGLKIAPKKCFLFQTKVTFLGHVVTTEGILPDPSKLDAIEFLQWLQHDPRRLLWSGTRNISWELFLILHLSYDQIRFGAW